MPPEWPRPPWSRSYRQGYSLAYDIIWSHTTILRLISDERITGKGRNSLPTKDARRNNRLPQSTCQTARIPAIISDRHVYGDHAPAYINKADAIRASKEPEEYLLRAGFVKCAVLQ